MAWNGPSSQEMQVIKFFLLILLAFLCHFHKLKFHEIPTITFSPFVQYTVKYTNEVLLLTKIVLTLWTPPHKSLLETADTGLSSCFSSLSLTFQPSIFILLL